MEDLIFIGLASRIINGQAFLSLFDCFSLWYQTGSYCPYGSHSYHEFTRVGYGYIMIQ